MRTITKSFTVEERERFHNLLKLAAESPFHGERANALAAAERMAKKAGLSLEDAVTQSSQARRQESTENSRQAQEHEAAQRFAQAVHLMDHYLRTDKARREAAMRVAQERGLDGAERAAARRGQDRPVSRRRMAPNKHAAVLLRETSFSFREISDITGLNVYEVVGMKLKMRAA